MRHTSIAASKLNIQKLLQNPKGSDDLDDGDYIEPLDNPPSVLYHVTNIKNLESIRKKGLVPRVGGITKSGHGDSRNPATPMVYLLDTIAPGIYRTLGKDALIIEVDPTENDVWFFTGYELMQLSGSYWGETIDEGDFPVGIEPGDYYSESKVVPKAFYDYKGNPIDAHKSTASKKAPSLEILKKGRVALSDEERAIVMKAKAVWHHGKNGAESPAVWKSEIGGDVWYVTNTHRAYQVKPTLQGAIDAYHDFIKSTATLIQSSSSAPTNLNLKKLKKVLASSEAYDILDRSVPGADTWVAGGCYLLAKALHQLLPKSKFVVLMGLTKEQAQVLSEPQPEHILLSYGGYLIDGDGISTLKSLIARWVKYEGLIGEVRLEDFDPLKHKADYLSVGNSDAFKKGVVDLASFLSDHLKDEIKVDAGISDVVYHFTSYTSALNILKENKFALTFVSGADDTSKPGDKYYYLSTTRSRIGSYHLGHNWGALLKLDGVALRHNNVGNPVDYWGRDFRKVAPSKNEMEDRIWGDKPYIKHAIKYIQEIHISCVDVTEDSLKRQLRQLLLEAKKLSIPAYLYADKESAKIFDKRKAIPLSKIDLSTKPKHPSRSFPKWDQLAPWLELFEKDKKEHLSTEPFGGAVRRIQSLWSMDGFSSFSSDVHNSKKGTPALHKMVQILKKNNWDSKDFYKHLQQKWTKKAAAATAPNILDEYTLYHNMNDPYPGVFTVYAKYKKTGKNVAHHTFRIYPNGKLYQHDIWANGIEMEDALNKYLDTGVDDPDYGFSENGTDNLIEREALEVDELHQRKGIATALIKYAENFTGKKCYPSKSQSPAGKKLWDSIEKKSISSAFKSDQLAVLEAMITSGAGTYDYLMSKEGDDEWEFYQSEDGELSRERWAKGEDDFNSQMGNPAHFFMSPKQLGPTWLVHFTNADPSIILKNGFKGKDTYGIGLTTQYKQNANPGDLAFAYPVNNIREMFRYGDHAVLFKVKECLKAYHVGDEEDQIIFDVRAVTKMYGLERDYDTLVLTNKNGKVLKTIPATKDAIYDLVTEKHVKGVVTADSDNMDFFFDVVDQYTSPLPTYGFSKISDLIKCAKSLPKSILDKYNDYPFEVYRGTQIAKKKYSEIIKGASFTIKPASWSKDEDEAIKFARGITNPQTYSVLLTKKIKNSDILLDLEAMANDGFFDDTSVDIDRILSESEIILKEITLGKDNIQIIDRDEDAEYAEGSLKHANDSHLPVASVKEILDAVDDGGFEYLEDDDSIEDYLRQFGDTGYFFDNPKVLKDHWLIHFTNSDPAIIKKDGFKGLDQRWLGLTKDVGTRPGNYALAYDAKDLKVNDIKSNIYGSQALVFKASEAVRAYHNSDSEYQVIFDVRSVDYKSAIACRSLDEVAATLRKLTDTKKIKASNSFMQNLNDAFAKIMRDPSFQKKVISDAREYSEGMSEDDVLERAFGEIYPLWMEDLEKRGGFEKGGLRVYRGISAKKKEDIKHTKLGIYWTWDSSKAANYSNVNKSLPLHVISALVSIEDIDLPQTLQKIVWAGYEFEESEREITLIKGRKIKVRGYPKEAKSVFIKDENVHLRQLYHGTHDKNLKSLVPRAITSLDTLGSWLSDYESASHYGPLVYRTILDKTVKLASFYDVDELFGEPWKDVYKNPHKLKAIKKKLSQQGFDGIKLSYLDGFSGYFVCLWHDYEIPLEKDDKKIISNYDSLDAWLKSENESFSSLISGWGFNEPSDFEIQYGDLVNKDDYTNEDGELDEYEYEEAWEKKLKEITEDRFDDWKYKYKRLPDPMILYRAVRLTDISNLNKKHVGVYWTDNIESASAYAAYDKKGTTFVLKAEVPKSSIDWSFTIRNNLNPNFGEEEQEINVEANSKIKILDIFDNSNDSWLGLSFEGNVGPIGGYKAASNFIAKSGKPLGKLYLFIPPEKLNLAVKSNRMLPLGSSQPMDIKKKYLNYKNDKGDTVFYGVSTTRNPNWKPNETSSHKYWAEVRLTLDGDKISHKYPVKSYNDFWYSDDYAKKKRDSTDEFYAQSEEKIITDKNGIKDWMQYLLAVDVLEDAREEFENLKLDFKNIPVSFVEKFSNRTADKYKSHSSITYYHGTSKELEAGRLKKTGNKWLAFDKKEIPEPFWLTTSLAFAKLHGPNVYACKLHIPSEKIFGARPYLKKDVMLYQDAAINEGRLVYDALEKRELFADVDDFEKVFAAIVGEDYDVIETKEFIDWAIYKGFGAAYVQGDGPRNLMVFNPEYVEILNKVSEHSQVEADFKDFVKKLGKLFLGLTLSTSAMGKHLDMKELKQKEAQVNQILNKTDDGNKYKLNIVEKKSGDIQQISFLMTMNGKQVGSIKFEGTPETNISDYSNIHTYFTPEGKSNEIIYKILTPALLKGLTERAE